MSDMSEDIYEEFFEMLSQMNPDSKSKMAPEDLDKMMAEMDLKIKDYLLNSFAK